MRLYGWFVGVLLMLATLGCGSASGEPYGPGDGLAGRGQVAQQILGVWRLQSYIPESSLSPAMMLGMQSENIVVRIENGRLSNVGGTLVFNRAYRVANVLDDKFTLFIRDDAGLEYESACELDPAGRVLFRTVTPPWRGSGVLERQGQMP